MDWLEEKKQMREREREVRQRVDSHVSAIGKGD